MALHPAYFETRFQVQRVPERWPDPLVILSAYATTGQVWTPAQNDAADHRLAQWLRQHGLWHHRITGYSPSTGHAEPSWAFSLPLPDACQLGQRFQQDAMYYVEGDQLWVTHCDDRRALVPVGRFRQRLELAP